jgi:hypothetical protein
MQLDIRTPIGLMFGLFGLILTIYGLATASDAELYKRSLGVNINLWWGLLFLAFAATMLLLARASSRGQADRLPPR